MSDSLVVLLWKMYIIENMIKNRVFSLLLIVAVYLLAVAGGLACFKFLQGQGSFSFELILLLADIFATVIVFIFSLIFRNASVYDPYWSVQPPVIFFALLLSNGVLAFVCSCAFLGAQAYGQLGL